MKQNKLIRKIGLLITTFLSINIITFGIKYEVIPVNAYSQPQISNCPENYYSQCDNLSGSSLQSKLLEINKPKSPSYDWSRYETIDEAIDDSTSIISIYTRHNIKKSSHCGNYSWTTWNREHIWTQSKYPNSSKDNHNIFACEGQINNYRGNLPFNEVEHSSSNTKQVFGHDVDCYWTSSYFEPCDEAKGEVARSVMYGTVMYSYSMTQIIKSVELALKWHINFPVTDRDIYRNNQAYTLQGNRNPFVDNPSYACKIWGNLSDETRRLCSSTPENETKLVSIVVSLDKNTIYSNDYFNAKAVANYSDSSTVDITKEASWSLSNPDAGLIYEGEVALNDYVGQLTIYATYEEVTGSFDFEVLIKEVQPPIDGPNEDGPNEDGPNEEQPKDDEPNKDNKGCKGSIYGTSIIISLLCLFGLLLLKFKRI